MSLSQRNDPSGVPDLTPPLRFLTCWSWFSVSHLAFLKPTSESELNHLRFVLADTEELHTQIANMSQRIRQLEDALSVAHSPDIHGDRHPLLRDDLLSVKFGSGSRGVSEETDDQFALSLGTLAVTDTGSSSYFGVSAGALVSHITRLTPCVHSVD